MRLRAPYAAVAGLLVALAGAGAALGDEGRAAPASVGGDGRVSVAVVAPISVPVGTPGLLTAAQLTRFTSPGGLLTQELANVSRNDAGSVTLAIDPRIIASVRVLGSGAPASAASWLQRLEQLPNETFPLTYADADPVLAGQSGLALDLTPQSFSFAIDSADFGPPTPTPTPSASATAQPGAPPALPQSPAEVLAWNWTLDDVVWPATDTVAPGDLPRLAAVGYGTVLLGDGNVSGPAGHVAFRNEGVPSSLTGAIVDERLSDAASAVADADSNGAELSLTGLASATQAAAADTRGAQRIVTLQRGSASSLRFLPSALEAMRAAGATTVPLSAVLASSPAPATAIDRSEPAERLQAMPSIVDAISAEDAFSSVGIDPVSITAPRRLDLLALLSTGWIGDPSWTTAVQTFLSRSAKLRDGVSLVASAPAVALGANVPLPVTVRNSLDVPIRVYAIVRPLKAALSIPADKRRVEITVQPHSTQTARVPTQSVANGIVRVQISLLSTSGVQVDDPTTLRVNVQAGWETVGTLVAVVLVLGVFGFGVTRNILRRRAARRAPAGGATDPDARG